MPGLEASDGRSAPDPSKEGGGKSFIPSIGGRPAGSGGRLARSVDGRSDPGKARSEEGGSESSMEGGKESSEPVPGREATDIMGSSMGGKDASEGGRPRSELGSSARAEGGASEASSVKGGRSASGEAGGKLISEEEKGDNPVMGVGASGRSEKGGSPLGSEAPLSGPGMGGKEASEGDRLPGSERGGRLSSIPKGGRDPS